MRGVAVVVHAVDPLEIGYRGKRLLAVGTKGLLSFLPGHRRERVQHDVLEQLAKGDALTILNKTGGWFQVKAGSAKGWVRMLSVRRGTAGKGSTAKDVAALSTGRAGTGQIVSTTGVRGLSEEELKTAKYDEKELMKAESFAAAKADATKFAQKGKLLARAFNYLPAN